MSQFLKCISREEQGERRFAGGTVTKDAQVYPMRKCFRHVWRVCWFPGTVINTMAVRWGTMRHRKSPLQLSFIVDRQVVRLVLFFFFYIFTQTTIVASGEPRVLPQVVQKGSHLNSIIYIYGHWSSQTLATQTFPSRPGRTCWTLPMGHRARGSCLSITMTTMHIARLGVSVNHFCLSWSVGR